MNNNTSRDRRLMITKNSILMLVMLVTVFLAIWAWYADTSSVTASNAVISAKDPDMVEIALPKNGGCPDDSDFTEEIVLENEKKTKNEEGLIQALLYRDITSDGIHFLMPTFEADKDDYVNGRRVITSGAWTEGKSSKEFLGNVQKEDDDQYNYIAMDFYLRSPSPVISVSGNSYLAAMSDVQANPKVLASNNTTALDRKNTFYGEGRFSADAIVGAMRVSLTGQAVTNRTITTENNVETRQDTFSGTPDTEPRFLWLPRPDIMLDTGSGTDRYNSWRLITAIQPTDPNYMLKTYRHTFYKRANENTEKGVEKTVYYDQYIYNNLSNNDSLKSEYKNDAGAVTKPYFHVSNVTSSNVSSDTPGKYPTLGRDCAVTSNNGQAKMSFGSDSYYVYKMTVNIWIEGADVEARRSMGDGQFKLFLEFT